MSKKNKEKSTPKNDEDKKQTVSPEVAKKVAEDEKKKADKKKADEKKIREQEKALKEKAEKERKDKKDKEAKKMKKKKVEIPGEHGKPFGGNDRASRCAK